MRKEDIKVEIRMQEKLLYESENFISNAPEGALYVRERKNGVSYYQVHKKKCGNGWKNVHKNINKQHHIINALTEKKWRKNV